jgi:hypothetical protein
MVSGRNFTGKGYLVDCPLEKEKKITEIKSRRRAFFMLMNWIPDRSIIAPAFAKFFGNLQAKVHRNAKIYQEIHCLAKPGDGEADWSDDFAVTGSSVSFTNGQNVIIPFPLSLAEPVVYREGIRLIRKTGKNYPVNFFQSSISSSFVFLGLFSSSFICKAFSFGSKEGNNSVNLPEYNR